ncbi:MAG: FMN-binding protein [Lachnospiraceae bacterium]
MTKDDIKAQKEAANAASYKEVCAMAESFSHDPILDDIIDDMDGEVYGTEFGKAYIDQVVIGMDASGEIVGYVIGATSGDGFDGNITMSVGFDKEGTVLGIAFTEISETAGMGMLCTEDEFKDQFAGVQTDRFILNKAGGSVVENEIDSVSGASVSSGAVVNAVNAAIDFYEAYLR